MVERRRDKGEKRERERGGGRVVVGCGTKRFEKNQKKEGNFLLKVYKFENNK